VAFMGKIGQIIPDVKEKACCAVIPIWNSHEGAIEKAKVIDALLEEQVRLHYLWPKMIQFEWISRGPEIVPKNVVSVVVAKKQCSRMIHDKTLTFVDADSTTDAYRSFNEENLAESALITPGQNQEGHHRLLADAANPLNFTTFSIVAEINSDKWEDGEFGPLAQKVRPEELAYYGVEFPFGTGSATSIRSQVFDRIFGEVDSYHDIPKVLFAKKYDTTRCRLILECPSDALPELDFTDNQIIDDQVKSLPVGGARDHYWAQIEEFLFSSASALLEKPFFKHIGTDTCFFSCPPLGIVTHGFEEPLVEQIVREMVGRHFELFAQEVRSGLSEVAHKFLAQHIETFQAHGMEAFNFESIG
jgi:hypothetical protein